MANHGWKVRDPWHYPRGELAAHLLKVFESGIVSRIAMFAPRRKGKTWFMLRDLSPAAVRQGYVPVFASLWRMPDRPQAALGDAARLAHEALEQPRVQWKRYLSRLASVGINVGGVSGSLRLAAGKTPGASPDELGRLHAAFDELLVLAQRKRRRILLLVDEAQHLATRQAFEAVTRSLRTMMEGIEATRPEALRTLFTGSSRTDLAALLERPDAAFYRSFESQELPDLDQRYTDFVAGQLRRLGGIEVDRDELWEVYIAFGSSPFYMQQIVRELMLRRATTIEQARRLVIEGIASNPQLAARWESLQPLERIVYRRVCGGLPLYAREALAQLREATGEHIEASTVQAAVRRLRRLGLISPVARGEYRNEDPDLLTWLRHSPRADAGRRA